jgi:hypothetical protein
MDAARIRNVSRCRTVPVEYAKQLCAAVGSPDKMLEVFATEEVGSGHVQNGNRVPGAEDVADGPAGNP